MKFTRRRFNGLVVGTLVTSVAQAAEDTIKPSLAGEVGVTTSSFSGHLVRDSQRAGFTLLELPRILRDELDMRVIDLNTSSLASQEPDYLDRCRGAAEKAGCVFTNLKMNQRNVDMNHSDPMIRARALAIYKQSIDTAARLGARWARPLPQTSRPDMEIHVAAYRELADYAATCDVTMLVENYGWMQDNPRSVVELVAAIGKNQTSATGIPMRCVMQRSKRPSRARCRATLRRVNWGRTASIVSMTCGAATTSDGKPDSRGPGASNTRIAIGKRCSTTWGCCAINYDSG